MNEATIEAMQRHGGNFVRLLAALYRAADCTNRARLSVAFADVFEKYRAMAAEMKREEGGEA
jgi:hypothetical protein